MANIRRKPKIKIESDNSVGGNDGYEWNLDKLFKSAGLLFKKTLGDIMGDGSSVAHYNFDNTHDDATKQYNLNVFDGNSKFVDGVDENECEASFPIILETNDGDFLIKSNEYTVSFWAKIPEDKELSPDLSPIISQGTDSGWGIFIGLNKNTNNLILSNGVGDMTTSYLETGITLDFTWKHIIITSNSENITVYLNGETRTKFSVQLENDYFLNSNNTRIKGYFNNVEDAKYYSNIYLDNMRILNKKINETEAIILYNEIKPSSEYCFDHCCIKDLPIKNNELDPFGNGEIRFYRFNDNTYDEHTQIEYDNYNLSYDRGIFGKSCFFMNNAYIDLNLTKEELNSNELTLSFWINLDSYEGNKTFLIENENDIDFLLLLKNGIELWDENIFNTNKSHNRVFERKKGKFELITNIYNHFVVSFKSGKSKIYVNNELWMSSNAKWKNNSICDFRKAFYHTKYKFNGNVSQFRIFKSALNSDEVKCLFYENKEIIFSKGIIQDTFPIENVLENNKEIGCFKFDYNCYDSDYRWNIYDLPSELTYRAVAGGTCVSLNKSKGIKIMRDDEAKNFAFKKHSVSFWFKSNEILTEDETILSIGALNGKTNNDSACGTEIKISKKGNLYVIVYKRSSENIYIKEVIYYSSFWNHLAITDDKKGTLNIYLNGNFVSRIIYEGYDYLYNQNLDVRIGSLNKSTIGKTEYGNRYGGCITELRFFNDVLTLEEIITIYNQEISNNITNITIPDVFQDNSCVSFISYDETQNKYINLINSLEYQSLKYPPVPVVNKIDGYTFYDINQRTNGSLYISLDTSKDFSISVILENNVVNSQYNDEMIVGNTTITNGYGDTSMSYKKNGTFNLKINGGKNIIYTYPNDFLTVPHYVVAVAEGPNFSLYIDGVLIQTNLRGNIYNNVLGLLGLQNMQGFNMSYQGIFSEFRVFDRALTNTEINNINTIYSNMI